MIDHPPCRTTLSISSTLNQDSSLLAQLVVVPQIGPRRVRLHGEVLVVEGDTITLRRFQGRAGGRQGGGEVLVDDGTLWHVPGFEDPDISDVEVNDRITAIGVWENETTFSAVVIAVARGRQVGQTGTIRGRAIRVEAERLVVGAVRG